jgi:schlafen family protein
MAANRSYYAAHAIDFARCSPDAILGALVGHHSFDVDQRQRAAWQAEILHLQEIATTLKDSYFFLEFAIPRMGKRADVVIISEGHIFVIEYKVGAENFQKSAKDQVIDYALDLKNFHEGSHNRVIIPILVATAATTPQLDPHLSSDRVADPVLANRETLLASIQRLNTFLPPERIDAEEWAASAYKPTPTIVEAAQALYQGHSVHEISRSEASAKNLSNTSKYIVQVISEARRQNQKAICFVTGVPGSGKTLAGLNIAAEQKHASEEERAIFLSGNGPLVDVLREALAVDEVERSKLVGKTSNKKESYRRASTFIQNIHHFRDEYVGSPNAPVEHVVVFDEAQRAWNKEHASRFMREKRGRHEFNMSEPEFLLSAMDRHSDWCVVICLIGGGQEINTGEAGLQEWLSAIERTFSHWQVHLSDKLMQADYLHVGKKLQINAKEVNVAYSPALHLATSVRSFRAEVVSDFVRATIEGEAKLASSLYEKLSKYPLVMTRQLETARNWLRDQARGTERIGLVASSNALRLKPAGIYVRAKIDPPTWFLANNSDVRSSFALEDVATEFDIQGLELDWVGMCWDANFRREQGRWKCYSFRGTRWERINDDTRAAYLTNSYRVLLTRARQGMVIYLPLGSNIDDTRKSSFYDETYTFLGNCGIKEI